MRAAAVVAAAIVTMALAPSASAVAGTEVGANVCVTFDPRNFNLEELWEDIQELIETEGGEGSFPHMCAWAGVGWDTFPDSDCGGNPPSEHDVCAAPTGGGGAGSNGGAGEAIITQDVQEVGEFETTCSWGSLTTTLSWEWDECGLEFDHGDPHWHDTSDPESCHFVLTKAGSFKYGNLEALDESCAPDITDIT